MKKTFNEINLQQNKANVLAKSSLVEKEIVINKNSIKHVNSKEGLLYHIVLETDNSYSNNFESIAKKNFNDLEILLPNNAKLIFQDYFNVCGTDLSCLVSLPTKYGYYYVTDSNFVVLEDGSEVVSFYGDKDALTEIASTESTEFAQDFNTNLEATDFTKLEEVNTIEPTDLNTETVTYANDNNAINSKNVEENEDFITTTTTTTTTTYEDITNLDGIAPVAKEVAKEEGGNGGFWALGLAAAGGLAAAASGAGGGSAAILGVVSAIKGIVLLGPLLENHGLQIFAYKENGDVIEVINKAGRFYIELGDYEGSVVVKTIDKDNGADYMDEATHQEKDLGVTLLAVAYVTRGTVVEVALTMLTTLAAQIAGVSPSGNVIKPLTKTIIDKANDDIAKVFKLDTIIGVTPITVVDQDGNPQVSDDYGKVLSALSGIDKNNNGNLLKTMADMRQNLDLKKGQEPTLKELAKELILQGAMSAKNNDVDLPNTDIIRKIVGNLVSITLSDTGISSSDGYTKNTATTINLNNAPINWEYSIDGGTSWQVGSDSTFGLAAGTYDKNNIRIRKIFDDNTKGMHIILDTTGTIVVDNIAPDAPEMRITNTIGTGIVSVGGLEANATWEYSTNFGRTWQTGIGNSFNVAAEDSGYIAGRIQVKQTDLAGNTSIPATNDIIINTPAITLELRNDTGKSNTDGRTNDGSIDVFSNNKSWQYSINNGVSWQAGNGSSFVLEEGTYPTNNIKVRLTGSSNDTTLQYLTNVIVIDSYNGDTNISISLEKPGIGEKGLTNNGKVLVDTSNIDTNNWQYSIDAGKNWLPGTNDYFYLPNDGFYNKGDISVREIDEYGNPSNIPTIINKAVTLDTTAPIINTNTLNIDEGITNLGDLSANEEGSWSTTITGDDADAFNLSVAGALSFKSAPDFETKNIYNIIVSYVDLIGNKANKAISINVNDINEAPVTTDINIGTQTAVINVEYNLDITAKFNDIDVQDVLHYDLINSPSWMQIDRQSGIISGTPPTTIEQGLTTVKVRATDTGELYKEFSFTLDTTNALTIISAISDKTHIKNNDSALITLNMSEEVNINTVRGLPRISVDFGDNNTVTAVYAKNNSTATKLVFTIVAPSSGNGEATITTIDLNGATLVGVNSRQSLVSNVVDKQPNLILDNIAPNITTTIFDINENETEVGLLSANEDGKWNINLSGADANAFNLTTDGILTLKQGADFETTKNHSYSITASFSDLAGNTDNRGITININDINENPIITSPINDQIAVVDKTYTLNTASYFSDPDVNKTLIYSVINAPTWLEINRQTGVISGSPTTAINNIIITIRATDNEGLSADQAFNMNIITAPAVSFVSANQVSIKGGDSAIVELHMTEEVVLNTTNGVPAITVNFAGQADLTATYIANNNANNIISFRIDQAPSTGNGDIIVKEIILNGATIKGRITNRDLLTTLVDNGDTGMDLDNTAPMITTVNLSVDENQIDVKQLVANENGIWDTALTGKDAAAFNLDKNGILSLKQAANFEIKDTYEIIASFADIAGNSVTQNIIVNINDINEAPIADIPTQMATISSQYTLDLAQYFTDVDANDVLNYTIVTKPDWLVFDNTNNIITGVPSKDSSGAVTIRATDNGGLFVEKSFEINIIAKPTISSVKADRPLAKSGEEVTFTLTITEGVILDTTNGIPTIIVDFAGKSVSAVYDDVAITASNKLAFKAIVPNGVNGDVIVNNIKLNGATIKGIVSSQELFSTIIEKDSGLDIDNLIPDALSISLNDDSGISNTDNVTNDNVVNVNLDNLESDATWEYSVNGGNSWQIGTGSSFILNEGIYSNNAVQVRQIDIAGNISKVSSFFVSLTVDTSAPTTNLKINNIKADANLSLIFNENIVAVNNKNISIYKTSDDSLISSLNASSARISVNNDTVEIDLADNLIEKESYYIQIEYGAFTDIAGNNYSGVSNKEALAFSISYLSTSINLVDNSNNLIAENGINAAEKDNLIITGTVVTNNASNPRITGITFIASDGNNFIIDAVNIPVINPDTGSWLLEHSAIPVENLLDDVSYVVEVTLAADGGNTGVNESNSFLIDTTVPTIAINNVANDNIIDFNERNNGFSVSGTTTGVADNSVVDITIKDKYSLVTAISVTATVANGRYNVDITKAEASKLIGKEYIVEAKATDASGNIAIDNNTLVVDFNRPVISITKVAADDNTIINVMEKERGFTIEGVSNKIGRKALISFNGNTYQPTITADGTWSIKITSAKAQNLTNGYYTIKASITDIGGNLSDESSQVITVNLDIPIITINEIGDGDNYINAEEKLNGFIVTGTATKADNATAIININNVDYAVDIINNSWSLNIPSTISSTLNNNRFYNITANVTNTAGNKANEDLRTVEVYSIVPIISINLITTDDIINASEKNTGFEISGTVSNANGEKIIVILNNISYNTTVNAINNTWSVFVPSANASNIVDTNRLAVKADLTDKAGNVAETAFRNIVIDGSVPTIVINDISDDNIINAVEKSTGFIINGVVNGADGEIVTVVLNNNTDNPYAGNVINGAYSININANAIGYLADGILKITAKVADNSGNTAQDIKDIVLKATLPIVTIDVISDDYIINAQENDNGFVVSGTTANTGVNLTDKALSVNIDIFDRNNPAIKLNIRAIIADIQNDGSWLVSINNTYFANNLNLNDGDYNIIVNTVDYVGNKAIEASHFIVVDTTGPTITIDTVAQDNDISATEKLTEVVLSGSVSDANGEIDSVVISMVDVNNSNNIIYNQVTAILATSGNTWSLAIPAEVAAQITAGSYKITATAFDNHNNTNFVSKNITVASIAAAIDITIPTDNYVIDATTKIAAFTITGTASNLNNRTVTIKIDAITKTANVVNNSWSVTLNATEMAAITDGNYSITATATSIDGNTAVAVPRNVIFDTTGPTITIDTVAQNDDISATEKLTEVVLSGSVSDANGEIDSVVISMVDVNNSNNIIYNQVTAILATSGNTWSLAIPAEVAAQITAGSYKITATAFDNHNNTNFVSKNITVASIAAAIDITIPTDNYVIDATTKIAAFTITGTASNLNNRTVTVKIDTITKTARVLNDTWSLEFNAAEMSAIADGNYSITATATSIDGNTAVAVPRNVIFDTTGPTITIDTVAQNDDISATEKLTEVVLSGSVSDANGEIDSVVISMVDVNNSNNIIYNQVTAILATSGNTWSLAIPAEVAAQITAGSYKITATAFDNHNNTNFVSKNITVASIAAAIDITIPTDNYVIDATTKIAAFTITGTASNLNNRTVTIKIDAITKTANVVNNSWSVTLNATEMAAITDGNYSITATATSIDGNTAVAVPRNVIFDTTGPTITIDTVAQNDDISATEKLTEVVLSGSVSDANGEIDSVVISMVDVNNSNNIIYNQVTAILATSGNTWSLAIPANVAAQITAGSYKITATAFDNHNNTNFVSKNITVASIAAAIDITIPTDNYVIDATTKIAAFTITGTASNLNNRTVTIKIDAITKTANVVNNSWSVTLNATEMAAITDGNYSITATATSIDGNTAVAVPRNVIFDTTGPTITIDTVAQNDDISATEKLTEVVLSGSVSDANGEIDSVVISMVDVNNSNNIIYNQVTAILATSGNTWSLAIPAEVAAQITAGSYKITATAFDNHNNTNFVSKNITVASIAAAIDITIPTDNYVIDATTKIAAFTITGTASNLNNRTVTVKIDTITKTARVLNDTWSLEFNAAEMSAIADGNYSITATATSIDGNTAVAVPRNVIFDTTGPTITIDTVAQNDDISATEKLTEVVLSGSVSDANGEIDSVVISMVDVNNSNNIIYNQVTAILATSGNTWSLAIPANVAAQITAGSYKITATAFDNHNNTNFVSKNITVASIAAAIDITIPTDNYVIDATTKIAAFTITGTASNLNNRTVTIKIDAITKTANVVNNSWSVTLNATEMAAITDGNYSITATATSIDGNTAVAVPRNVIFDTTGPTITIDTVAQDNDISATEKLTEVVLSGSVSDANGEIDSVVISMVDVNNSNNIIYNQVTAILATSGNTWSLAIPANVAAQITAGSYKITATAFDNHNNTNFVSKNITVASIAAAIDITIPTDNYVIDATTKIAAFTITGTASNLNNRTVTIKIDAITKTANVVNNSWSVTLNATEMAAITDGNYSITATATSIDGNTAVAVPRNVIFDTTGPTITIDTVAQNDDISATEKLTEVVLSGSVSDANGEIDSVVISMVDVNNSNNIIYNQVTAILATSGNTWSLAIPAEVAAQITAGSYKITATAFDNHNNTNFVSKNITVASIAAAIDITIPTDNYVIDATTKIAAFTITGTASNLNNRTVTIKIDAITKTANVVNNSWSVTLNATEMAAITDGNYSITATATSIDGNTAVAVPRNVIFDTTGPTITIDTVAQNDDISATEKLTEVVLSGSVSDANGEIDSVVISMVDVNNSNNIIYNQVTAILATSGNTWSLAIPANVAAQITAGSYKITATAFDNHNNTNFVSKNITVASIAAAIDITIPTDNYVIDATTKIAAFTITGTASNLNNRTVTVKIDTITKTARVLNDTWSLEFNAAEMSAIADGNYSITATATSIDGNTAVAVPRNVIFDTTGPTITIDTVAQNDDISATEKLTEVVLSGSVSDANGEIDSVVISMVDVNNSNNIIYNQVTAILATSGNTWSLAIPANVAAQITAGSYKITATAFDNHNNTNFVSKNITVASIAAAIDITIPTDNYVIDATTKIAAFTITGTASNLNNRTVTVKIDTITKTARVLNDTWSLEFNAAEMSAIADGNYSITATATSIDGNTAVAVPRNVIFDTTGPAITIDTVAQNDDISATEKLTEVVLSGSVSDANGEIDSVVISMVDVNNSNNIIYNQVTAILATSGNTWSLAIPANVAAQITAGSYKITATAFDNHNNTNFVSKNITVASIAAAIDITIPTDNYVIDATTKIAAFTITGTASNLNNRTVTIKIDAITKTANVVNNSWSVTLNATEMAAITDGNYSITATATSIDGNTAVAVPRNVIFDTTGPTITIDTVAQNDDISATEKLTEVVLSGSVSDANGEIDSVVISMVDVNNSNNIIYNQVTAILATSGNTWSLAIPAEVAAQITAGSYKITATAFDNHNNTNFVSKNITVASIAAAIDITIPTDNYVIDATTKIAAFTITGTASNLNNRTVTIKIDAITKTANVVNNSWSVTLNATEMAAITDGNYSITATATSIDGNTAVAVPRNVIFDTTGPTITIDTVAQNDDISATEKLTEVVLSGSVSDANGEIDSVVISMVDVNNSNNIIYNQVTAILATSGNTWSLAIPAEVAAQITAGSYKITATAFDNHNNTNFVSKNITVASIAAAIDITIPTDNYVIDATTKIAAFTITGTASNLNNRTVTVKIDTITKTARVLNDTWSLEFNAAEMSAIADGNYSITATATSIDGNTAVAVPRNVIFDTTGPTITIDTVAQNDDISATEKLTEVVLSGSVSDANGEIDSVVISMVDVNNSNNIIYNQVTAILATSGNTWSLAIPANVAAQITAGSYKITATAFDNHNNTNFVSKNITVASIAAAIDITIPTDNYVIDATTKIAAFTITGTASNLNNRTVTIKIDAITKTANVVNNSWSVTLNATEMAAITDGNYSITATATSIDGNTAVAVPRNVIFDTTGPTITIDTVAQDNDISATEKLTEVVLSGSVSDANGEIDSVVISMVDVNNSNNIIYNQVTAILATSGNTWSLAIPANVAAQITAGSYKITATAFDNHNNTNFVSKNITVASIAAAIDITIPTDNYVIDATTKIAAFTITGTASNLNNRTVTIKIDAITKTANVVNNSWSVTLNATEMAAITDGNYSITATATSIDGNTAVAVPRNVIFDTTGPTITIDTVAQDNDISATEKLTEVVLSGSVSDANGEIDSVVISMVDVNNSNNIIYNQVTAILATSGNTWSLAIPANVAAQITAGSYKITATAFDNHNNTNFVSKNITVASIAAAIDITIPTDNYVIDATTKIAAFTITGTASNLNNRTVTVKIDTITKTARVLNDTWSLEFNAAEMSAIADGNYSITATATSIDGNTAVAVPRNVIFDTTGPTITIDTVAQNDDISATEKLTEVVLSGSVSDANGEIDSVVISMVDVNNSNNIIYNQVIAILAASGNSWSLAIPANVAAQITAGSYKITATALDNHGNSSSTNKDVTVEKGLYLNAITGNNIIDQQELISGFNITGSYLEVDGIKELRITQADGTLVWNGWDFNDSSSGLLSYGIFDLKYNMSTFEVGITYIATLSNSNYPDLTVSKTFVVESLDNPFILRSDTLVNAKIDISVYHRSDYAINWGLNENNVYYNSSNLNRIDNTYSDGLTHDIAIFGDGVYAVAINSFSNNNGIRVVKWGDIAWESMRDMFYEDNLIQIIDTKAPIFANNNMDLSSMFRFSGITTGNSFDTWDMLKAGNVSNMFSDSRMNDSSIINWNVSNITNMSYMFSSTYNFNQDISGWIVSSVTNMEAMFAVSREFNQDIGGWIVSSVTNMKAMFRSSIEFNQDIGGWDVSSVIDMSNMFESSRQFNQDIGGWDVSHVVNMSDMFLNAEVFNQNLGNWNIKNVTNMDRMFDTSLLLARNPISLINMDATLLGWADVNKSLNEDLQRDVSLGMLNVGYTNATAMQYLIDHYNWSFIDANTTNFTYIDSYTNPYTNGFDYPADINGNYNFDTNPDGSFVATNIVHVPTNSILSNKIIVGSNNADIIRIGGIDNAQSPEEFMKPVTIHALGGDDTIVVSAQFVGEAIIYGGAGDDTMIFESNSKYVANNSKINVIYKYDFADSGNDILNRIAVTDTIDISVALDGYNNSLDINDFVRLSTDKTIISIDHDGDNLSNNTFTASFTIASANTPFNDINTMLGDGSLIVI